MFTELENLLRHAGMPDLAEKVCVWSTDNILAEARMRPNWNANLADWERRWSEAETIACLDDEF